MSRQPIYDKDNNKMRIISVANGLWQFQQFSGQKGTREHDPWRSINRATDLQTALSRIKTDR